MLLVSRDKVEHAVADLHSKIFDAPLPGVQILSISCSFWEILAKSYVGAPLESWHPHLGEILDPPLTRCIKLAMYEFIPKRIH